MNFGSIIKKLREDNNLSIEEFSDKINISEKTVTNWEKNKSYPDMNTLVRISNDFKLPLDDLIKKDRILIRKLNNESQNIRTKQLSLLGLILIFIASFVIFKLTVLNSYSYEEVVYQDFNSEPIQIIHKESDNLIEISDHVKVVNFLEGFTKLETNRPNLVGYKMYYEGTEDTRAWFAVLRNDENALESVVDSFPLDSDKIKTNKEGIRKYLKDNNINNYAELFNFFIENEDDNTSNIFTPIKTIEKRYRLNQIKNLFIQSFDGIEVRLLTGDYSGIIEIGNPSHSPRHMNYWYNDTYTFDCLYVTLEKEDHYYTVLFRNNIEGEFFTLDSVKNIISTMVLD